MVLDTAKVLDIVGTNPALVKPYGNYLLVRIPEAPDKAKEQTLKSGLIVPAAAQKETNQVVGEVICAGYGQISGITHEPITMYSQVGDWVLLRKHSYEKVILGGETFYCIAEGDVIGKIDKEALQPLMGE